MKVAAILLAAGLLCGCGPARVACKPEVALDVHIDPACLAPCKTDAGIITDDPSTLIDYGNKCEARRMLCVSALLRAQQGGKIK